MKKFLITIIFLLIILVLWQVVETNADKQMISQNQTSIEAFVPTPLTIINTFAASGSIIVLELKYTLFRAMIGLLIGLAMAFLFFFIFVLFPSVRFGLLPLAFAINSFPVIGFAPLIVLTFGQGSALSIIFIAALISYFPILVGLDSTFKNVDKESIEMMNVLNANKRQMLTKIFLPASLPNLFTSLRLAIPASIIGATIGEWLGVRTGIGQLITVALYQLKPGLLYAALLSVTVVSIFIVWIISLLEKKVVPWKYHHN